MGFTPESALKLSVSSESMPVPEGQPATVRLPMRAGMVFDLERLVGDADDDELAVGAEAADRPASRLWRW